MARFPHIISGAQLGGLGPGPFQQINKVPFFYCPHNTKLDVFLRWRRRDSENFPVGLAHGHPSCSPPVIRNSNKNHWFSDSDFSKLPTAFSPFINLKNNIHRPYLLVTSFDLCPSCSHCAGHFNKNPSSWFLSQTCHLRQCNGLQTAESAWLVCTYLKYGPILFTW